MGAFELSTFRKKTIRDVQVDGKTVLVRVDFNVPLQDGVVMDDTRIRAAIPTIEYLLAHNSKVVLCSHLGRPKGVRVEALSLAPVADRLSQLLGNPVEFSNDCVGAEVEAKTSALEPGQVLLLENTRFHLEEKSNDPGFARSLASLGELFVNDAFGSAHRAHASSEGVAHYLPAVAGFLMEREIAVLGEVLSAPERPFVAVLGGAKISDKIGVVENLIQIADTILLGGGMANTFLASKGIDLGDSLVEVDSLDAASGFLARAGEKIHLPIDLVVADGFSSEAAYRVVPIAGVETGWQALDIGPETISSYVSVIKAAETIVWNGPVGVFEFDPFAKGTNALAKAIAATEAKAIIGGGDSAAAIRKAGLEGNVYHVSTGGGASLEFLEGKVLPGVAALEDK